MSSASSSRRLRLVSTAALAVAVPLAGAVPAVGATDPVWQPTVVLGAHARQGSVTVDASGRLAVVWETGRGAIEVKRRSAAGSWGSPVRLGRTDSLVASPQVAADRDGTLTVVWVSQRAGYTDGVVAVRHPVGGPWSRPVRLSADLRVPGYPGDGAGAWGAASPSLAVSRRGAVVVAWQWGSEERQRPWRIQSAFRRAGGRWSGMIPVTGATGAHAPEVAVADDGTATVAYSRQTIGHPPTLLVRDRRPGRAWGVAATVAAEANFSRLAVDRAGDAVVGFMPTSGRVMVTERPRGGQWGAPQRLTPQGVHADDMFDLAMGPRGAAVVAWARPSGRVDVVRRPAHGAWSAPEKVVDATDPASLLSVALDRLGDTFVVWGEHALHGSYRPAGGAWGAPVTLSPDAGVDVLEAVDAQLSPSGSPVVLWQQEARPLKVRVGVVQP